MRRCPVDGQRLERIRLINRIGQLRALFGRPVFDLIAQFDSIDLRGGAHRRGRAGIPCSRHFDRRGPDDSGRRRANRLPRHGSAWRHMLQHPCEQGGSIGCDTRRRWKHIRIIGWNPVDHGQPGRGRRAVFGVNFPVDGGGEQYAPAFLQGNEGIPPCRNIGRATCTCDHHQTTTIAKPRQCRRNMPHRRILHAAINMGDCREGRVHQHNAGTDGGVQIIMNVGSVETGDGGRCE